MVILRNIADDVIAQIPVPMVADGWIALPTRVCAGAYTWKFMGNAGDALDIEEGLLNEDDIIGLWRVTEKDKPIYGPELYPWTADQPLEWRPLNTTKPPQPLEIETYDHHGFFIRFDVSEGLDEPGIFIQDNGVVGWTFGPPLEGGFLWTGDNGKNLYANLRVDDFYRLTFADSREEKFTIALGMGKSYSPMERLEVFAEGFLLAPKLSAPQTPPYLRPNSVVEQMRAAIAQLVQKDLNRDIADIIDSRVLTEAGSVPLLMDVITAVTESYGIEKAIYLTEEVRESMKLTNDPAMLQLNELHSRLYRDWLTLLLENANTGAAWQAFESARKYYPDDPEIHLVGVALALADSDWAAAEEFLRMRSYPPSLADRVQILQARISELKGAEGQIVIRFAPGSRSIPVEARLNERMNQKFIIDTGASMVTLPSQTIEGLGIQVSHGNPIRRVVTAGGTQYAPEVVLASLELRGWTVYNVKALVLDIPNQPRWGLLGLNYLRRFRMNLNTEEGMLLLQPR